MPETFNASDLIERLKYSKEAPLRIYLGGSPGVGKTYRMLRDGNGLLKQGVDVVVGYVESHGRVETDAQIENLEVIPKKQILYRGKEFFEMDTDAVILRKPQIVLVDELAHTNTPGSRHEKRYQDIEDLLAAGIAVFSTCNVQHLESVHDTVEQLTGIEVKERVPDTFFALAKEIIMVDVSVEELQERLLTGKIYKPEKVQQALHNFFTHANISLLREMALREVANDLEQKDKELRLSAGNISSEKVMVAIADREDSKTLIRYGSRMSGRINAKWFVVYVEKIGLKTSRQKTLQENFRLAKLLGAQILQLRGKDITETLINFAHEEGITQIILGATQRPWWKRFVSGSVVGGILKSVGEIAVHVFPLKSDEAEEPVARATTLHLTDYLKPEHILTNIQSVHTVEQTISLLIDHLIMINSDLSKFRNEISDLVMTRERLMSTFLESGIAIPHAAGFEQISDIHAVMALTPKGVTSLGRDQKAYIVLLFLSPEVGKSSHLKFLSSIASVFIDQTTVREVSGARSSQETFDNILKIENTARVG
ncbi:MAG TPA: PTS sugar transporter subunit IIA [Candidatus Kapabacteria bacterium]|nr:PTS sugar transporter subunit IIA [Candidatus Kapabacteria bacterium]